MENANIRNEAKNNGVYLWEIAERIGIPETSFCRKLRRELPSEQQEHILREIHRIAEYKREQEVKHREA